MMHYRFEAALFLCFLGLSLEAVESLKCYKCLNLDCPEGGEGEKNERLCQSVRSYIIKTVFPYYEIGPAGYLGACPAIDETLQWSLMQQSTSECPEFREGATCSLGRIQVISGTVPNLVTSHATVLGCLKPALLYYMKNYVPPNSMSCSTFKQNNSGNTLDYVHRIMLENCPKLTEYCNTKNFCVPFHLSIVKAFQPKRVDTSFETGIIISIIAVILVLIIVAFLAGTCRNPLSRTTNYTAANMQIGTKDEILKIDCPSTSS